MSENKLGSEMLCGVTLEATVKILDERILET